MFFTVINKLLMSPRCCVALETLRSHTTQNCLLKDLGQRWKFIVRNPSSSSLILTIPVPFWFSFTSLVFLCLIKILFFLQLLTPFCTSPKNNSSFQSFLNIFHTCITTIQLYSHRYVSSPADGPDTNWWRSYGGLKVMTDNWVPVVIGRECLQMYKGKSVIWYTLITSLG